MTGIKKIQIGLEDNSYNIIIGENLIGNASSYIKKVIGGNSKIFIITDENVAKIYLDKLESNLKQNSFKVENIVLKAGEATKSFKVFEEVVGKILAEKPERKSTIIALGGGVIGDLSGFAASSILRGINFIQIPTSLLAMVDSSVGGKTGINTKYGKNLIGAFYQPKLVLSDISALKTLPEREVLAGYAEIVKYGLICDKEFFKFLEQQQDWQELPYMVEVSCRTKAAIVEEDEKEKGVRALLNLGHTFGHALETIMCYDGRLLHGEAVAIGMVMAYQFSEHLGLCEEGRAVRLEKLLKSKGLRTSASELGEEINANRMIELMYSDKKVADNKLVFILAEDIGKCIINKDVTEQALKAFFEKIL